PAEALAKDGGRGRPPLQRDLQSAVASANLDNLSLDPFALCNNAQIEEGAFGKGYALDRMLARIHSREALIDFGGQLAMRGTYEVSIADPARRDEPVLAFTMSDGSLSTSSGSEKPGHILDPRDGQSLPPRGSVSVIANDALTADILSTALYVLGEDDGLRWANDRGIAAIFIAPNRTIRLSAPARLRVRGVKVLNQEFKLKD
ncbi:MAG TPA: FAD:protein FMN transferase, partial [Thermoanaerobaculia bacterium]|nr:FAD:protein FMN transferase [Thermoanaerobaculia bacterium]